MAVFVSVPWVFLEGTGSELLLTPEYELRFKIQDSRRDTGFYVNLIILSNLKNFVGIF